MLSFPLLGRSRSWAAPVGLSLLSLLVLPLLCASPARAAHWVVTYQTNGIDTGTDYATQQPYSQAWGSASSGGGYGTWAAGNSSGDVTPILTWTLDSGETVLPPAPDSATAVVNVYITANMDGTQQGGRGGVSACTTSATDGAYGDTFPQTTSGNIQTTGGNFSHLEQKSGGGTQVSLTTIHCTAACSSNGPNSGGFTSVIVTTTPLNLALAGTTPDGSGNLDILVGQYCSASWVIGQTGGRIYVTLSNYQWSVSGTTFQTWQSQTPAVNGAPANLDASYYVDGPGPLTNPTAGWYWNDLQAPTVETVSCTATVTPPPGYGAPFPVTVTQKVTVMRPQWTATGTGGNMQVNTANPAGNGTDYYLYAGPTPGSGGGGGMDWHATVSPPPGTAFGAGSLMLVQLIIPDLSYTAYTIKPFTSTHTYSLNGQEVLDLYPYPWITGAPNYYSNDNPGLDLTYFSVVSATVGDQFEDYLMYFAPGSNQCVPLAYFVWSTSGSATIPATNNWANYGAGSAGRVTPSGTATNFGQSNSFPMWTELYTNGSF